ncbi:hypothetical protein GMMP1_450060 [Candidatus Magnetomoraceae bacterium gMMP-1]
MHEHFYPLFKKHLYALFKKLKKDEKNAISKYISKYLF